MDHSVFFNRIRHSLYGGRLSQSAVDNINVILGFWDNAHPDNPRNQLAYILATVLAEVGRDMNPVRETFANSDAQARARLSHKPYAQSVPPHGHAYYGRGYVQLTWRSNYQTQENKLGVPLVREPDLALNADIAIQVLVGGMMAGDFNRDGHGLPHYVNEQDQDFFQARRTVNILDRAFEIAGYATRFLNAIEAADLAERSTLVAASTGNEANDGSDSLMLPSSEHMDAQQSLLDNSQG